MSLITHLQQLWAVRGGKSGWQVYRDPLFSVEGESLFLWALRSFYINTLLRISDLLIQKYFNRIEVIVL